MYDFANILFAGRCNARCPMCIGRLVDQRLNQENLKLYPPRGLEQWIVLIREHSIREVTFTGTNTDPLLYQHAEQLLSHLRRVLPAGTRFSLHTNGRLALRKIDLLNQFDRISLSLPSFHPPTYRRMMGVNGVPYLAQILRQVRVPVKLSCLVTDENVEEIPGYLKRCVDLSIRRVVLRQPVEAHKPWEELLPPPHPDWQLSGKYRGNQIYSAFGIELTLWNFEQTRSTCINLFANGEISTEYRLIT
ncbi:MAG: radical SAM protein [Anaerolineales bacterium]|nr:radical SAM protein [Anaerolineales bacterium]